LAAPCLAQSQLTGSVRLHDPSRIVKENGRYYLYSTGNNGTDEILRARYSDDLSHWFSGVSPILTTPTWTNTAVPGHETSFWAPDIIYLAGQYHLYYSVSTFGSQRSAIGLATNAALNPADPNYEWVDQGAVIQSQPGSAYNTIDPGVFLNDDGRLWMTFGSFWSGVYITELDPATGKRITPTSSTTRLAQNVPSTQIEAPYLHKHDDQYYLFVNWGRCCQGVNSTYNIRVGRGASPTGPFLDKNGVDMVSGGGSLFLGTEGDLIGPGHMSIYAEDSVEYFSYHYYDGADFGRSKLNLRTLAWTPDGWPIIADTLPAADFNHDGVVDAGDLAAWAGNFGVGGDADADKDSDVDGGDFLVWQRQLGQRAATSLNATSAPEPHAAELLIMALAAAAFACRLHQSDRPRCRSFSRRFWTSASAASRAVRSASALSCSASASVSSLAPDSASLITRSPSSEDKNSPSSREKSRPEASGARARLTVFDDHCVRHDKPRWVALLMIDEHVSRCVDSLAAMPLFH
jgi:arabinan endo-1,5-alpha-L-arabinosidase